MLELTKSYDWIPQKQYPDYFVAAWRKLTPQLPTSIKLVVVAPLLKPRSKRPKSSDHVYYAARGYESDMKRSLPSCDLKFCPSATVFAKKYKHATDVALILVDDYVGSGDTARKALSALSGRFPNAKPAATFILAFAAHTKAVAQLKGAGCIVVAEKLLQDGISGNPSLPSPQLALQTMDEIGKHLGIAKDWRRGYKDTEGIITLIRTPNNTFPVYWTNKKVKGQVWDSPFTRYKE